MSYRKTAQFKFDSLASILLLLAFLVGMFFIVRGIFLLLLWVSPLLLIAAFILDRSVVINYVKWLTSMIRRDPLKGIGLSVLSLAGYMFVFPYLFFKALLKKKFRDVQKKHEQDNQGELIDFEEIESKPKSTQFDLPPLENQERRGEYDRMFE